MFAATGVTQGMPATRGAPHGIECGIGAIGLHLINDLEKAPEFAARPTALREPLKIFRGQIVDGNAAGRKAIGTEFAERHAHPGDLGEVRGHVSSEQVFHAGRRFAARRRQVNPGFPYFLIPSTRQPSGSMRDPPGSERAVSSKFTVTTTPFAKLVRWTAWSGVSHWWESISE